ncbi:single-stranded DNA-binding protein [Luteimonas sp. R10]|uniref:single-stranded DNA-binding protein n=1 Tax=Luteimonas sp. R10 TaxID=3108176 RepID=UPI00308DCA53|nr:single-stranded DNA-binding protein [Luteimonas sp. R10]
MSNVTITITSEEVIRKSGTKNGKDWEIREQAAVIEAPDRKQPVRLDLGKNDPHKVGKYLLDFAKNLNVSQFGSVQLRRTLELTPVPAK